VPLPISRSLRRGFCDSHISPTGLADVLPISHKMARTLSLFSLLATISLVTSAFAMPISMLDRGSEISRTIRMPIARRAHDLSRRNMIQASLSNGGFNYFVETQIGTPPQTVSLKIDTGSSDTWAYTPAACSAVNCQGGSCKFNHAPPPNSQIAATPVFSAYQQPLIVFLS
jgi:hypothetical protein